jgi:hypothetical protein
MGRRVPGDYKNWADEEPNNMYDQGEHRAVMNWRAAGEWNDMSPTSARVSKLRAAILERSGLAPCTQERNFLTDRIPVLR